MLPYSPIDPKTEIILTPMRLPDESVTLDVENKRIRTETVTDLEALKQRIFCILSTELDAQLMLPEFGVEKNDLYGNDKEYVFVMLCYRMKEALLKDDCITDVSDFVLVPELSGLDHLYIRCRVQSVFGDTEIGGAIRV